MRVMSCLAHPVALMYGVVDYLQASSLNHKEAKSPAVSSELWCDVCCSLDGSKITTITNPV